MHRLPIYLLCCLVITLKVKAEEVDTLTHRQVDLNEIVIRSFKQDKALKVAPVAATVINSASIRNLSVTGMKDFSSLIPNLFIPDYGSKLTSPVFIRGIGSKINAPSVGLYVDGIPYFEKSAFDFDFAEVDHVEVLRGPQGTLYGRNTMGGIINVYTRSPFTRQGTNLSFSAGSYSNFEATASHYTKLRENLGLAVGGNYSHSGGYYTNEYTGKKADPLDEGSLRIRLEWQAKPQLTVRFMSTLDLLDQGGYPYGILDTETRKIGAVNYDQYSSYTRTLSTTGATLEYLTDKFKLNSQTAFQYLSDDQRIDQDFTPQTIYFATQSQKQKMISQELTLKSNEDKRYKWLWGAFGFWQGVDNEVGVNYYSRDSLTTKYYDIPTYGLALYHQSTIDRLFMDGLSLTLGLRYDYERATNDYQGYATVGKAEKPLDHFNSRLEFSQLLPKFSLQYAFHPSHMLYGTIAKGYKTGGFNSSFERDEDRSFDPEFSWNYEIGSKLTFLDNRLKAEIALFYIDWKNQQIYQSPPSGTGQMLKNAGRSESKGTELSLQANPVNGLILNANYGYTHATFKEYIKNESVDYSGNYIPLVPSHTLAIGGDYTLTRLRGYLDRMTFSLHYTGTGKIYWSDENDAEQPYYGLLNARISGSKGIWTAALWAKNITNQEYATYAFKSGYWLGQKGRPFTIGAQLTLQF